MQFPIVVCVGLLISLASAGKAVGGPLSLNATISGQLDQPGDLAQYSFTGTPGQRLIYDGLGTQDSSLNVRLISPSGTVLFERNWRSDIEPFTLLEAGMYTLVIDGNGPTTGPYSFRLLDLASQPTLPIGSTVTKSLDPGNSADVYTFSGTSGQRLFFDGLGTAGGALWYLYAPNNQQVTGTSITQDFETTLAQTGTFALVVWGSSVTPVTYSFQAGASSFSTNALALGSSVTGSIDKTGDQRIYSFTGTPGQRLVYDGIGTDALQINARLISPAGTVLWERNSRQDVEPFALAESGTYTLVLDGIGSAVGSFTFRLLDLSSQPVLALNTTATKTLDPGTSVDFYQLSGTAGQHLFLDGLGNNSGAAWYLYGPNNAQLGGAGIGSDFEVTLSYPGTYLVGVYGTSANPVPYSVRVLSSTTTALPLSLGQAVVGNVANAGDQFTYTFDGTVGQEIYYDALDRDFEQINSRLLAPSGNIIWDWSNQSNDQGPFSLPESGSYTLWIDGAGSTTGGFRFRVLDLGGAPSLSVAGPTAGQLNPSSGTDAYKLDGKLGQRVNFKTVSASQNQATWRLVGTANQTLANTGITSDLGDVLLPAAGLYWLLIEGNTDTPTPLTYQFVASDKSDAAVGVSGFGDVHDGTIAAGQQDTATFTAPAGLWVYFDSQDRTAVNLAAELKDPSGKLVFSVSASNDSGPYILPQSGSYTLVIHGYSPTVGGTFRYRLMDLTNGALPLQVNTTVSGNLDPAYRTDVYQFNGHPGQRLIYDALENDGSNVAVRIVGPDGQIRYLNGNSDNDSIAFMLLAGGTHYLIFESNMATASTYSGRLLDFATQPELPFGTPISKAIDPGLGMVLYRFDAASNLRLYFDGLAANAGGSWYLIGPNNATLAGTGFAGDIEFVTQQNGSHILALLGNSPTPVTMGFTAYKPNSGASGGDVQITSVSAASSAVTLEWTASAGKVYRVQYKADLNQPPWSDLPGDVTAVGPLASKTDQTLNQAQRRYYRVQSVP